MERNTFFWIGVGMLVVVILVLVWLGGGPKQAPPVDTAPPVETEPTERPPAMNLTYQVSLTSDFFSPNELTLYAGSTATIQLLSAGAQRTVQMLAAQQEPTIPVDSIGTVTFSPTKAGDYTLKCIEGCAENVILTVHVR